MGVVSSLAKDVKLPKMVKVIQKFSNERISVEDIPGIVSKELSNEKIASKIKPGMKIAITCGSRGISNIALITKSIVSALKEMGADPFVVPAMGSHGGATANGQKELLEGYGVTEEYIGCKIVSSMEVKKIGINAEGMDVYIDKNAAEADGIIVAGRVKPHTAFRGEYESGLMKMMTIGLGKQYGAEVSHESGFKNMGKYVPMFGKAILKQAPIIGGLAILEDPYDHTRRLVGLTPEEIVTEEPKLLLEAKDNMPKIYFDNLDILIVDKIGKNFSGDGMDPNITGTFATPYASGGIKSERVVVLDMSDETHGNGAGIGAAHTTTRRFYEKMDFEMSYPNAITCTVLDLVKIPMVLNSDKEAIQIALKSTNNCDKNNPRIVRIKNSLDINEIYISEALIEEAKSNPNIEIVGLPENFPFDSNGNLW